MQDATNEGNLWIDLSALFVELGLPFNDFNDLLKILQDDEKLLNYDSSITTKGLQPISIIVGQFKDVKSINFSDSYVFNFKAKLTLKGIKYKLEE